MYLKITYSSLLVFLLCGLSHPVFASPIEERRVVGTLSEPATEGYYVASQSFTVANGKVVVSRIELPAEFSINPEMSTPATPPVYVAPNSTPAPESGGVGGEASTLAGTASGDPFIPPVYGGPGQAAGGTGSAKVAFEGSVNEATRQIQQEEIDVKRRDRHSQYLSQTSLFKQSKESFPNYIKNAQAELERGGAGLSTHPNLKAVLDCLNYMIDRRNELQKLNYNTWYQDKPIADARQEYIELEQKYKSKYEKEEAERIEAGRVAEIARKAEIVRQRNVGIQAQLISEVKMAQQATQSFANSNALRDARDAESKAANDFKYNEKQVVFDARAAQLETQNAALREKLAALAPRSGIPRGAGGAGALNSSAAEVYEGPANLKTADGLNAAGQDLNTLRVQTARQEQFRRGVENGAIQLNTDPDGNIQYQSTLAILPHLTPNLQRVPDLESDQPAELDPIPEMILGGLVQAGVKRIAPAIARVLCFPGETPICVSDDSFNFSSTIEIIQTDNTKKIDEIHVGEFVKSCNLKTNSCDSRKVLSVFENVANHFYVLSYRDTELRTTDEHPFYVLDQGWVKARDLKEGNQFLSFSGKPITLEKIREQFGEFPVYNLEVEGNNNYFAAGVLVHNCNEAGPAIQILRNEIGGGLEIGGAGLRNADSAQRLGFKTKSSIDRYAQFSKQIFGADAQGVRGLDKIFETAEKISPRLGDKFVRELPTEFKYRDAFETVVHRGTYEPGELVFQAQRTGQKGPGNWFSPIKPINPEHAEELLYINKHGNDAGQVKAYIFKERVSGYAGKVKNGAGYQFHIPEEVDLAEVLEEVVF